MKYLNIIFFFLCLTLIQANAQDGAFYGKVMTATDSIGIHKASVFIDELNLIEETSSEGNFTFQENIPFGTYTIQLFANGYTSEIVQIEIKDVFNEINFTLAPLNIIIEGVEIKDTATGGTRYRLRNVEDFGLYGGKTTALIPLANPLGNAAVNNPRQLFKRIAGLNIHENDAAGLQLSIGGRGLDPNRTANFNTRQNGYDISADALGYPESYYTPPALGLKRIEVVRGAASLQYGTQFGGLLNFVLKDGKKDTPLHFVTENNYGSNKLFTTFNSVGGQKGAVNYYGFYNYKRGDGFRPSSGFEQHNAYGKIKWDIKNKLKIGLEYTYMNYLSQQPGGLQDFEFNENPYQSKRVRNWFKVNWNLYAAYASYAFNPSSKINTRFFYLSAGRDALGELAPINRPDPLRERDLIEGRYQNIGNETRFLHRYNINQMPSTLLVGMRMYKGFSISKQGDATDGSDANFNFITEEPNISSYEFPSTNFAFFAENLFNINAKWSISPGIRLEYIKTASDGYFYQRVISGGQVIFENKIDDARKNKRRILLGGLGTAYRISDEAEVYANFSQNFRSINFSDLAVQNPNLIVDSLLQDEKGYNFDLGFRGSLIDNKIRVDATAFALRYNNRIGIKDIIITDEIGFERVVDFRTNIGDALILGLETYVEMDLISFWKEKSNMKLKFFNNFSYIHGRYLSGGTDIKGNEVELIPPINWKTGLTFEWKKWRTSLQYNLTTEHFSDATNAISVANATRGIIPTYAVLDLSTDYQFKQFKLSTGINNLANEAYFTRRTASYPGPGIIPAQGRNFYVSLKWGISLKENKK